MEAQEALPLQLQSSQALTIESGRSSLHLERFTISKYITVQTAEFVKGGRCTSQS